MAILKVEEEDEVDSKMMNTSKSNLVLTKLLEENTTKEKLEEVYSIDLFIFFVFFCESDVSYFEHMMIFF